MSLRGSLRASKTQKPAFAKTLKNIQFFKVFGVQRHPKRALGNPRRLPRGTQGAPKLQKRNPKMDPKIINFSTNFGAILGAILGPKNLIFLVNFGAHFRDHFGGTFCGLCLAPFWDQIGPGSGQDKPEGASQSFEDPKSCIRKNLKKHIVF